MSSQHGLSVWVLFQYVFLIFIMTDLINGLKISMSSEKSIAICLFSAGSILRINDNPCLKHAGKNNMIVSPILIDDGNFANDYIDVDHIHNDLSIKIKMAGGKLIVMKGNMINNHINNLKRDNSAQINLLLCQSWIDPIKSSLLEIKQSALDNHINVIELEDSLVNSMVFENETVISSTDLTNFLFTKYEKKLYSNLEKRIALPENPIITYIDSNSDISSGDHYENSLCGEDLAESLLKEYIKLGDRSFSYKYADQYISTISTSLDHTKSLHCLKGMESNFWGGAQDTKYFQGEVISGLINPLISLGCVSPKLLIHARDILFNSREKIGLELPIVNRIKNEAVRKDWHTKLAFLSSNAKDDANGLIDWNIKYTNFKGYIQREGTMISESSTATQKPLIFLIHGFGGSLNQMTTLAQKLYPEFDICAIDMLGFGHSEKGPISYNQYFWRDQVVAYIKKTVGNSQRDILLMGNSIGGFIVSAAAATLAVEYEQNNSGILPKGLVLCNSAGDLASDLGGVVSKDFFKSYQGPPSEFLRVFGQTIFGLLQPRIEKTLEWLYPSNKKPVKDLAKNILRDSCDLGAADVIASGGKLPSPEPMASLIGKKFKGPTLIAQGILDPLNDASSRANQFGDIRNGIDVVKLDLGHCPFHEDPDSVSQAIINWAKKQEILKSKNINIPANNNVLV